MKKITISLLWALFTTTFYAQCFSKISAGGYHNIGIKPNGTLSIWGNGSFALGTLGTGNNSDLLNPTQLGTSTDWNILCQSAYNTFVIKNNGTLWATGYNNYGQLGNGNYGTNLVVNGFIQIGTATNWKIVAGDSEHTTAIQTNGTLWAWGHNNYGQLGDGTTADKYTPSQIGTANNWKYVATSLGLGSNIAIKTDGSLWGWGWNGSGALGTADFVTPYFTNPIPIGTDVDWYSVDVGYQHTLAIKTNGKLYFFGGNVNGCGGQGLTTGGFAPIQIGTDNNWSQISAGYNTSFGIKTDGTLWAWGQNDLGQLGDGTMVNKGYPTQIGTDTNWASVQAGVQHCIALKTDGSLWAWGDSAYAQMGTGGYINSAIPVQINVAGCALGNDSFDKAPINLYPNPTNGIVTLNNSEAHYQSVAVYNYLGQEVTQQKLTESNNQTVDLSSFSNGVYLFKLQGETHSKTLKVLKE